MTRRIRVAGELRIYWEVELPEAVARAKHEFDPAKEAVIESLPQSLEIYMQGKDKPPTRVSFSADEDDAEIDEDEREDLDDEATP